MTIPAPPPNGEVDWVALGAAPPKGELPLPGAPAGANGFAALGTSGPRPLGGIFALQSWVLAPTA